MDLGTLSTSFASENEPKIIQSSQDWAKQGLMTFENLGLSHFKKWDVGFAVD